MPYSEIALVMGRVLLALLFVAAAINKVVGPKAVLEHMALEGVPRVLLPVVVLCLTFALFYMLMPNTKVRWKAAVVGGLVGAVLFYLNNLVSVLYVSRVVSNSKIYGSLGLVPVFI